MEVFEPTSTRGGGGGIESYATQISVFFEVLTAVIMKAIVFWDITPCSLVEVHRRFGGTYRKN
jgi:hypothetical protein